jgi:hypothetical protein
VSVLTDQFFANVLRDPIDHLLKEQSRIPDYGRYDEVPPMIRSPYP